MNTFIFNFFSLGRHSVIFVATLILGLSTLAHAKPPSIPDPPDASVKTVSKTINYDGLPLKVQRFESRKSLDRVLSFYKKKWARPLEGHPGYLHDTNQPWEVISRLEDGYLLTVQVRAKGRSQSWGYLAVSNMAEYLFDETPSAESFPSMQGSRIETNVSSEDPGLSGQTVVVSNAYSAQSNANFYKNHYADRGWLVDQNMVFDRGSNHILRLLKSGQELTMVIQAESGKTTVVANKITLN